MWITIKKFNDVEFVKISLGWDNEEKHIISTNYIIKYKGNDVESYKSYKQMGKRKSEWFKKFILANNFTGSHSNKTHITECIYR